MRFLADSGVSGLRLDVWLSRCLPEMSRSRVQGLIRDGWVRGGVGQVLSVHSKVSHGLEVEVEIPAPESVVLKPEDIPLEILFEDGDIIVINKPAGLVVHPAAGHASGTLVNALLHHCNDLAGIGGELRPGIVHRLDKDTTGVMVSVKNEKAMAGLVEQFKCGRVRKEYVALVWGVPQPAKGTIETLIGRSVHDRKKMSVRTTSGRLSVTHYSVEESFGNVALVRVRIETGRTHQIRVHMAHVGHSVVGDPQYGSRGRGVEVLPERPGRQMLHATSLSFEHPRDARPMVFSAPLPVDFASLLKALRGDSKRMSRLVGHQEV